MPYITYLASTSASGYGFGRSKSRLGYPYGGGYFAGQISTSGDGVATHNLVIAPKSSGQSNEQWRTFQAIQTTPGTQSVIDGPTNTSNMDDPDYPAAQFCLGLTIGGYSDWYMPAKNELEVCYYNLKPTSDNNFTDIPSGVNANSVPTRSTAYTSTVPGKTIATDFQSPSAESFDSTYYYTSTESTISAGSAQIQTFSVGFQTGTDKTQIWPVRAVRRIAL